MAVEYSIDFEVGDGFFDNFSWHLDIDSESGETPGAVYRYPLSSQLVFIAAGVTITEFFCPSSWTPPYTGTWTESLYLATIDEFGSPDVGIFWAQSSPSTGTDVAGQSTFTHDTANFLIGEFPFTAPVDCLMSFFMEGTPPLFGLSIAAPGYISFLYDAPERRRWWAGVGGWEGSRLAGEFYAFTSLFPAPAQEIPPSSGEVKLQLGPDGPDDDWGYSGTERSGFALDTSTTPAEQIIVPPGTYTRVSGRWSFLIFGDEINDMDFGLRVTDDGVTVFDAAIGSGIDLAPGGITYGPADFMRGYLWPVDHDPIQIVGEGRAFLWVNNHDPVDGFSIADTSYIEIGYGDFPP